MSDIGPYGVTQHADAEMVTANQLVGQRIDHPIENQIGSSPATFSTAPFVEGPKVLPKERPPELSFHERVRPGRCIGKNDTCKVYPIRGTDLCIFHTKQAEKERRAAAAVS